MSDASEELARRLAAGDRAALETLMDRELPALRAYVRARMGPRLRAYESGSDLVQSTCREILTHLDRFEYPGEAAFKHWLFKTAQRKIARRAALLGARKRENGGAEPWPSQRSEADVNLASAYRAFSSVGRRAEQAEDVARIEAALDALAPEQREVLLLAHFVGLSRAEIAAELGKTEGAVRATLHRALARIAILLRARPPQ